LDAMLEEVARKGHSGAEIEAALRRVGLADEGWPAEFLDRDVYVLAAYERLTERLLSKAREGCARGGAWPDRVRCGLVELLEELAAQPLLARALTRSFASVCPEASSQNQAFAESLASLLAEGRDFSGVSEELPAEVEMLAVGAAEAIIFEEIEAGRAEQLPALGPEILFSLLVPFLGPEAAVIEMSRTSEVA
jgi:hypothetical protein